MNITITKPTSDKEIKEIAFIHYENINLGFLSKLGPKFLYYLYLSMLDCSDIEFIVAKDEKNIIGFITGATSLKPVFYTMIRHHFFSLSFVIIPQLFSITNVRKLIEIVSYTSKDKLTTKFPEAELLSLAVIKDYRGTGVSQDLFLSLKERFKSNKHKNFKIIVGEELELAQSFYKKMGAVDIGSLNLHSNSPSIVFKVEIE